MLKLCPGRLVVGVAIVISVGWVASLAQGHLETGTLMPLDHPAIPYAAMAKDNPVERLEARLRSGDTRLHYDQAHGYLKDVLRQLEVPSSSQVLVFSKTSFQAPRIAPRTPRAIYHNDDTTVGFVRGGDVLEFAVQDAQLGAVFYTLDQEETARPGFQRRGTECLQCHDGTSTLGVPGFLVRSICPDRSGSPLFPGPSYVTDHRSPIEQRWGGWYVTGTHGATRHMGNVYIERGDPAEALDTTKGANVEDLRSYFDTGAYVEPSSDLVSLMVLEHQTRMMNLITRLGWETRMALKDNGQAKAESGSSLAELEEELVKYMLFADEAAVKNPIRGSSRYSDDFASMGPRDRKGRSLRQLDLKDRMFRYPCSFLIYSKAFDTLPDVSKERVYRRLWTVLAAKDTSDGFPKLSLADRHAIIEILADTKQDLPAYWKR